jgi:RHS repeat-associated protein
VTANLVSLPNDVKVSDGNENQLSYSSYYYDETQATTVTGVVGHDDSVTPLGNLTTRIDLWSGNVSLPTRRTYDSLGNVLTVTDPLGHTTSYSYQDAMGLPNTVTNALNQSSSFGYDPSTSKMSWSTDVNGVSTWYHYDDPLERLTSVQTAAGTPAEAHTSISYNVGTTDVHVRSDKDSAGDGALHSETIYDGFGRPVETRQYESGSGYIATTQAYNALGQIKTTTNPSRPGDALNYATNYFYDTLGRTTQVQTPDGAKVCTSYSGNEVTVLDAANHARTTQTDPLGRLTAVTEDPSNPLDCSGATISRAGAGYSTTYTYDALNNLTNVNQSGRTRTFDYDSLGRLKSATNPESGKVSYTYDNAGNVKTKQDARGVTTTYTYDALNRLTGKSYSDGTAAVTYGYDASNVSNSKGQLTSIVNGNSATYRTSFDAVGNVLMSSQTTAGQVYGFGYTYNLAGGLVKETYPSGRVVTTAYDGANRVSGVSGTLNGQVTPYVSNLGYAAHGAVQGFKFANNVWRGFAYNNRLQFYQGWDTIGSNPSAYLFVESVNRGGTNNNGTVANTTVQAGGPGPLSALPVFSTNFSYDNVNRLVGASDSGGWSRSFGYDPFGNMWVTGASGGPWSGTTPTSESVFTAGNQINGNSYDLAGNQTSVNGNTVAYDAENLVKSITAPQSVGGGTETILYDGAGQRVEKTTPSGSTVYVYDAFGQLTAEYSTVASATPCTRCYVSTDHLGSTRLVTDQSGNVVARHDFLPYGEEIGANSVGRNGQWGSTTDVAQKFTGQIRDQETGMDYFNARYFNAALGRFTSPDPGNAGADPANPQTWNGYGYLNGNPMNAVDPSGMTTCSQSNSYCGYVVFNTPSSLGLQFQTWDVFGLTDLPPVTIASQPPTAAGSLSSVSGGYLLTGTLITDPGWSITASPFLLYAGMFGQSPSSSSGGDAPPKNGNQQQNDVPLNDYAQALFTDPTLQRTARVMTNPCTYAAWTGAAAAAGAGGVAVAHGSEIAAAVSDNSATLIHKALTWWFNFTGRPSSGAMKAATLTAPVVAGAVAKACNGF